MPNEIFNYKNINAPLNFHGVYEQQDGDFISQINPKKTLFVRFGLSYSGCQPEDGVFPERAHGWKLHVSIDDNDPTNIENGWNIIKDILIKYRIYYSKIVRQDHQMEKGINDESIGEQRGKQITIYTSYQPNKPLDYWKKLAEEITYALAEHQIKPSYRPGSDIPVTGSNYVSYRCDGFYNEQHVQSENFSRYPLQAWKDEIEVIHPGELATYSSTMKIESAILNQPPVPNWVPPTSLLDCCPVV
jgi:hypothetical protein